MRRAALASLLLASACAHRAPSLRPDSSAVVDPDRERAADAVDLAFLKGCGDTIRESMAAMRYDEPTAQVFSSVACSCIRPHLDLKAFIEEERRAGRTADDRPQLMRDVQRYVTAYSGSSDGGRAIQACQEQAAKAAGVRVR